MVSRFQGSGRAKEGGFLGTHKQDHNAHVTGGDFRHGADNIDMNPPLTAFPSPNAQGTLELIAGFAASTGTGFVSVGNVGADGYATGSYNAGTITTPTFREAILAAFGDDRLQNGGIVFVLPGTYTLITTVDVPAGISIMGEIAGTIISGEMTEQPMFKFLRSTDFPKIGGDSGAGEINAIMGSPIDESKLFNITLVDNLDGSSSGMQTVPMVLIEDASRVHVENVKFLGRVNNGAISARGKTLRAIGYTPGGPAGSHLTVRSSFFDGMETAISFRPNSGDIDHLVVDKCRARTFGTEDAASADPDDNCFVSFSQCNATLSNNYHISETNGVADTALYCFVMRNSGGTSDIRLAITGNAGDPATAGDRHILTYSALSVPTTTAVPLISGNTWGSTPFTIDEDTTFGRVWRNVDNTIALQDKNMVDDTVDPHYLTSSTATDGDTTLRILEAEDSSPPTIFKNINGRWTVTVGDGTNSFGDFNGSTAIIDALVWWQANCGTLYKTGICILIKPGNYDISSTYTLPDNVSVLLQGTNHKNCFIRNAVSVSATTPAIASNLYGNGFLEIRNITFYGTSTSQILMDVDDIFLRMYGVRISAQNVSYTTNDVAAIGWWGEVAEILLDDVRISAPASHPCVRLTSDEGSIQKVFFKNCGFIAATNIPAVEMADAGNSSARDFEDVRFQNCSFRLLSSPLSSGDLTGNCGVLELVPGSAGNLTISVNYENCEVLANSNEDDNNILLYLRTTNTAGTQHINVRKFKINGGKWYWSAVDSDISPFYIGGNVYNAANYYIDEIDIQDVEVGPLTAAAHLYGNATDEVATGFSIGEWAAFYLRADKLIVKNVRWTSCVAGSGSGEMWFYQPIYVDVDGIYLANWTDNSGNQPEHSIKIWGGGSGYTRGVYKNIVIFPDALTASQGPSDGFFYLRPNEHLRMENCEVFRGGADTANTAPAFFLESGTGTRLNGLELVGCKATWCYCLLWLKSDTGHSNLDGLIVKDCEFENGEYGIYLSSTAAGTAFFGDVNIEGCKVSLCQYEGITFEPGNDTGTAGYITPYKIVNNSIKQNYQSVGGIGRHGVQVKIGGGSPAIDGIGDLWYGVMIGNDFGGDNTNFGQVWYYNETSGAQCMSHGAQTDWPDGGVTDFATGNVTASKPFMFNRGEPRFGTSAPS